MHERTDPAAVDPQERAGWAALDRRSLVKSLAMEWGKHNIRVNAIAPGLIQTDFAKALWDNPEIRKASESKAALKRIGQPDDIGGVAVFLASKAGNFVCGQTIIADGGVIGTGAE